MLAEMPVMQVHIAELAKSQTDLPIKLPRGRDGTR